MRTVNRTTTSALLVLIGTMLTADRAWAQIDLTGEWAVRLHEDVLHRNDVLPGGLAVGDYTGLPINDAARRKADSWDASILSARERQTIPGPSVYGRAASVRIAKIVDNGRRKLSDSLDALAPDQLFLRRPDRFAHALKCLSQSAQFVLAIYVDFVAVVLLGDLGRGAVQLRHRFHDFPPHQVGHRQRGDQCE